MAILFSGAVYAIVWAAGQVMGSAAGVQEPDAANRAADEQSPIEPRRTQAQLRRLQQQRAAEIGWEIDPFALRGGDNQGTGLVLSGIIWDPSEPIALINGEMLHVGEEVNGFRIATIGRDRVSLSDGTRTIDLTLQED